MKKLLFLGSTIASLFAPVKALARTPADPIQINAPEEGFKNLGDFVTNAITFVMAISIILVLVMLIWGAFEWITSGGDKEAVGKARGKIINALIGLAVMAVAFALAKVGAQFVGFNINQINIPTPP